MVRVFKSLKINNGCSAVYVQVAVVIFCVVALAGTVLIEVSVSCVKVKA